MGLRVIAQAVVEHFRILLVVAATQKLHVGNCIGLHTHTHTHTHVASACISDGIWTSSVGGTDVHSHSHAGCQHWGRVKGAWTFLYISLDRPMNCFIIKSFKGRHDSIVNLPVPITCFYNYQFMADLVSSLPRPPFHSSNPTLNSWELSKQVMES